MKTIAVTTLGCKVNQFESASFINGFEELGCTLVPFSSKADVYVINTCTVTNRAGQQSRQLVRRAMRLNPDARIVVTGCYAQMDPDAVLAMVDNPLTIVGNGYKHLLVDAAVAENPPDLVMLMGQISRQKNICSLPVQRFTGRTRAYLRVQDGCDNFCSYCIVPFTRGRSRSVDLNSLLEQTTIFEDQGYREIVITGINVGKYGLDLDEGLDIYSFLDRLCGSFNNLRIRLSSVEPTEVNDSLLELIRAHDNFMPHLHIPLQSGDDQVLARMNRRYTGEYFAGIINKVHSSLPQAAIGCDVLGGFPGETAEQAENTYQLLASLPISYMHVFPYSKRPGTLAASFTDQLPGPVKQQRVARLHQLDIQKRNTFYNHHLNSTFSVLVERRVKKSGLLQGFSDNYIPIQFEGGSKLIQSVARVRLDQVQHGQPIGTLCK